MIVEINYPDGEKEAIEVDSSNVTVGRGSSCELIITDDNISRKHLGIELRDGVFYIKDLTLSNWVSYNEEKLSKVDYVQYFDFATLMLPGGISLTIKTDRDQDQLNSDLLEKNINSSSLSRHSKSGGATTTNIRVRRERKPVKKKNTEDDKSMKKFMFLTAALLLIGGYVTMELFEIKESAPVKTVETIEKNKDAELEGGRKLTQKTANFSTLKDAPRCTSRVEKELCQKYNLAIALSEGVHVIGSTAYVKKEVNIQGLKFFKHKGIFIGRSGNLKLFMALALDKLILPSHNNFLIQNKITNVIVYLFDKEKNNTLHSQFSYKPTDFSSLVLATYREAYRLIRQENSYRVFDTMTRSKVSKIGIKK